MLVKIQNKHSCCGIPLTRCWNSTFVKIFASRSIIWMIDGYLSDILTTVCFPAKREFIGLTLYSLYSYRNFEIKISNLNYWRNLHFFKGHTYSGEKKQVEKNIGQGWLRRHLWVSEWARRGPGWAWSPVCHESGRTSRPQILSKTFCVRPLCLFVDAISGRWRTHCPAIIQNTSGNIR